MEPCQHGCIAQEHDLQSAPRRPPPLRAPRSGGSSRPHRFRCRCDDLDVDADSILVLRGCGPRGYPGMPEVANMALPRKLLEQDVRDMVRVCDGRMSGTAYGPVVLHVTPEAAVGGPLALVEDGDFIVLDVAARRLEFDVPDDVLAQRVPSTAMLDGLANPTRGWERLYVDHVQQADTGADLDFLVGAAARPSAESRTDSALNAARAACTQERLRASRLRVPRQLSSRYSPAPQGPIRAQSGLLLLAVDPQATEDPAGLSR